MLPSAPRLLWILFFALVPAALLVDVGAHRLVRRRLGRGDAVFFSALWIALGLGFGGAVWAGLGRQRALEYLTGYLIEKSLSIDNLFVFLALFAYLGVPRALQRYVLFLGILGALVFRGVAIGAGTALIARFHFVLYGLGVVLLVSAVRMLRGGSAPRAKDAPDAEANLALRFFRRHFRTVDQCYDSSLTVMANGRRCATPLLAALFAIEVSDAFFALDSVPAVLAVTRDRFIVYTSNVFALLGMRALYFALAAALMSVKGLRAGLAVVLGFVGGKLLLDRLVHVPAAVSLGVILAALALPATWTTWQGRRAAAPARSG